MTTKKTVSLAAFVAQFVPALRTAVQIVGWPKVKESLQDYLSAAD